MNKKLLTILLSVLLPTFLVGAIVYATTSVGDDITVEDALNVTGITTLTGILSADGGIRVDNNNFVVNGTTGALVMVVATTTGHLAVITLDATTTTGSLTGLAIDMSPIIAGDFAKTAIAITGDDSGTATAIGIALDGTVDFGINMSSSTINTADIVLSNGATIHNTSADVLTITEANVVLTTATTVAASAENHGLDVNFTGTMGSASGAVAGNFVMTTAGTGGAWASGIYAKVVQGETKNVTGYLSGAEFEIVNTNTDVSDWFPLVLNANSTTNGQHSSYIALRDYGTTKIQSFLWVKDQTIGTNSATALVSSYTTASSSATHSIRIIVDDTPYWILLSNTAPN